MIVSSFGNNSTEATNIRNSNEPYRTAVITSILNNILINLSQPEKKSIGIPVDTEHKGGSQFFFGLKKSLIFLVPAAAA